MCSNATREGDGSGRVRVTGILAGIDVDKNGLSFNCPLLNLRARVIRTPDITSGQAADQFDQVFNYFNHRRANQRQFGGQRTRGRPPKKAT